MKASKALVLSLVVSGIFVGVMELLRLRSLSVKYAYLYFFLISFVISYLYFTIFSIKKNQSKQETSPSVLEFCEDGIIVLDQELNISYLNSSFAGFLGLSKVYKKLFYDLEVQKNHELFEHIKALLKRSYQYQMLLKESITTQELAITFEVTLCPLEDRSGFVVLVKDTTKNVRSVTIGKEFISNATHELRTPITIIKGFVETLRDLPEISEDMLDQISDKILRSCNRMDRIVKNLLILTDLDHLSKAQFKNFDLEALVDNCKHTLNSIFPTAVVTLHCFSKDSNTFADPDLLELAIMNLMQNAVKYSPAPAVIDISVDKKDGDVVISISDKGQGVPKEFQESIFDRFATVDKTASRKLGGAGLGLSIVKTIVEKHGGRVSVASNENGGTTFSMHLPEGSS